MTTIQKFPVFAANQVLRHDHLNDLVTYLEEQSRLTRNKTIGIGVICGFKTSYAPINATTGKLLVSEGVGITSAGYLINTPAMEFTKYATYTKERELSSLESDIHDNLPYTQNLQNYSNLADIYPFFKMTGTTPVVKTGIYELITATDSTTGMQGVNTLNSTFLEGKVLVAYLNFDLSLLKSCEPGNCDDKGAKLEMQVRFLLVTEAVALEIVTMEKSKQISGQIPLHAADSASDNSSALRTGDFLGKAMLPKLNLVQSLPITFNELKAEYITVITEGFAMMKSRLNESMAYYPYLLSSVYSSSLFSGLIQKMDSVSSAAAVATNNVQYFYDFLTHLTDAFNEFRDTAIEYDAICSPTEEAFPKHLLLGRTDSAAADLTNDSQFVDRNPSMRTGSGFIPLMDVHTKSKFRHKFFQAPELDKQNVLIEKLWSLHYRIFEMVKRFNPTLDGLTATQAIPSKSREFYISERAGIPFYFNITNATGGVEQRLVRNWSYHKTIHNRLKELYSYQRLLGIGDHPLGYRQNDQNFFRLEGHIGKSVEDALGEILNFRRSLGLDFKIKLACLSNNLGDATSILGYKSELFKTVVARDPGLEHMAGVPQGGTFILVYTQSQSNDYPLTATEMQLVRQVVSSAMLHLGEGDPQVTIDEANAANAFTAYMLGLLKGSVYFNDLSVALAQISTDPKYRMLQGDAFVRYINEGIAEIKANRGNDYGDQTVVADFALHHSCCEDSGNSGPASVTVKECEYFLFDLKVTTKGINKYTLIVAEYSIAGQAISGPTNIQFTLVAGSTAQQRAQMFCDALNAAYPSGLFFSVGNYGAEVGIKIRVVDNQPFKLKMAVSDTLSQTSTYVTYTENGFENMNGDVMEPQNCSFTNGGYSESVYADMHISSYNEYVKSQWNEIANNLKK